MADLMDYATTVEVARMLGCSEETVQRYCREGRLKAEMVGGSYLIERKQLAGFQRPSPGNPQFTRRKV